jgi:hypothetical protein
VDDLDARPSEPQFRGIREVNAAVPWAFLVGALFWGASWLPRITRHVRLRLLSASVAIFGITTLAGLGWMLYRYGTTSSAASID